MGAEVGGEYRKDVYERWSITLMHEVENSSQVKNLHKA